MRFTFFIALFLFMALSLCAQEMPIIQPGDLKDIKINRTEYYNGNSLWGYIDGGADLYLEYGFSRLAAQEIEFNSAKYKVDIYRMNSPQSAFGIFSISRFKCSGKTVTKYSCVTPYQVMAAKGSYYISIANEKGNGEEQKFTIELAGKILARITEPDYETGHFFSTPHYNGGEIKFINGRLGVQNGIADWEPLFDGIENFSFTLCSIEDNENFETTALIKFASVDDLEKFMIATGSRSSKKIKHIFIKMGATEIAFTETNKL